MNLTKTVTSIALLTLTVTTFSACNHQDTTEAESTDNTQTENLQEQSTSEQSAPEDHTPKQINEETNWKTYTNTDYQFQYPEGYTVTEPTEHFKVLTLEGPENKALEIFKVADYQERPFGFTGTETQEEVDAFVPKEIRRVASEEILPGPAHPSAQQIWLFWPKGNSEIKEEVKKIADSLEFN